MRARQELYKSKIFNKKKNLYKEPSLYKWKKKGRMRLEIICIFREIDQYFRDEVESRCSTIPEGRSRRGPGSDSRVKRRKLEPNWMHFRLDNKNRPGVPYRKLYNAQEEREKETKRITLNWGENTGKKNFRVMSCGDLSITDKLKLIENFFFF